ncbi:MAG: Veg family protein [Syntrophothermus sp.]
MAKVAVGKGNVLGQIRADLRSFVGQPITVKANRGRKRVIEAEGILEQTYPNIFVVRVNGKQSTINRLSYTYSDVLTETVLVTVAGSRIGQGAVQSTS